MAHGTEQLDFIFDTLTKEGLIPSPEFYYGFCCNLFVGSNNGNLTMFDFNAYKYWDVEMAKERKRIGEGALMSVSTVKWDGKHYEPVGTLAEYNAAVLANLWMVIGKYYE